MCQQRCFAYKVALIGINRGSSKKKCCDSWSVFTVVRAWVCHFATEVFAAADGGSLGWVMGCVCLGNGTAWRGGGGCWRLDCA